MTGAVGSPDTLQVVPRQRQLFRLSMKALAFCGNQVGVALFEGHQLAGCGAKLPFHFKKIVRLSGGGGANQCKRALDLYPKLYLAVLLVGDPGPVVADDRLAFETGQGALLGRRASQVGSRIHGHGAA